MFDTIAAQRETRGILRLSALSTSALAHGALMVGLLLVALLAQVLPGEDPPLPFRIIWVGSDRPPLGSPNAGGAAAAPSRHEQKQPRPSAPVEIVQPRPTQEAPPAAPLAPPAAQAPG